VLMQYYKIDSCLRSKYAGYRAKKLQKSLKSD
jgi:hypothetical protein